jgi:hypothetical protein
MKATTWRRLRAKQAHARSCVLRVAALLGATVILAQCAAVPPDDPAQPVPPADYGKIAADALKKFKDFSGYTDFQISAPRWVHAATGWSWLTCVRYNDRGRRVFYSFFIDNNAIVNARYDVRTDQCTAQQYVPLDVNSGTIGSPGSIVQSPLY